MTPSLSARLVAVGRPLLDDQLEHPTVRGIADGTLDEGVFRSWLEQDHLFLLDYVRVFSRLAWQAPDAHLADLVVIGSHCIGLDYLLSELQRRGIRSKFLAVGSTAGLDAASRGECDVAGFHVPEGRTSRMSLEFDPGPGSRRIRVPLN